MDLKTARKLLGLSQAQLGKLAGLDGNAIYDLESKRNRRPAHEVVVKIVRALQRAGLAGITADDLFPVPDQPDQSEAAAS